MGCGLVQPLNSLKLLFLVYFSLSVASILTPRIPQLLKAPLVDSAHRLAQDSTKSRFQCQATSGDAHVKYRPFNPAPEHSLLRQTVRDFVREQVEPQALAHHRDERLNLSLFRQLGELGLLGITVASEHGGAGMDAVAAVIVHEELSA